MASVEIKSIDEVASRLLAINGVSQASIDIVLDTINFANQRGVPTHGVGRLPLYIKKIRAGNLNPKDEIETVTDSGAVAILDAHGCLGQVAAKRAIDLAIEKAACYGIAAVGVQNSNNFGMAGYFGDYAAKKGMAALIFANASPAIAPTGGKEKLLGTNPLCFAFPGGSKHWPVVLDMATSVVARGKIRLAAKNEEKIPLDWALDENGQPTDDPKEALKGSLLPFGGYKGYGLSLFVDIFAGLLTGSAFAGGVEQLSKMDSFSNNGHLFIVMDSKRFMSEAELDERVDYLVQRVKACGEPDTVRLPGESGYAKMTTHIETVELPETQISEINHLAEEFGLAERLKIV